MAWPTPQDYNEAIQNPQSAFGDAELRMGKPELNALQLPRAITGQFASVYKMKCGSRIWAVRCFLRNVPNQQQRYEAISAHLAKVKLPLPYVVDFEYQPQGIRVRGQHYPILKMAWVNGESLTRYIESHLTTPGLLGNLAYRWAEMTQALRRAGVAHGDLQHGNVLVREDALTLVDYDGMFVPALAGQMSYETGHRNFQSPQRNETHFDAQIDNFSAWVIYVSLYALRIEPALWQRFVGGDECLLFRRRDFESPNQSELLKALTEVNDTHLRSMAIAFRSLLIQRTDVGAIPPLDLRPDIRTSPRPSWLADHVGNELQRGNDSGSTAAPSGPVAAMPTTEGTLLDDALLRLKALLFNGVEPATAALPAAAAPSPAPIFFEHNPLQERLLAYAGIAASLALAASMVFGAVPLTMGGVGMAMLSLANVIAWVRNYQRDAAVVAREQVRADIYLHMHDERKVTQRLQKLEREREKAQRKLAEPARKLERQHERMKADEQAELNRLHQQTRTRIASLQTQRQAVQQKEDEAIRKSKDRGDAKMAELQQQIINLGQAEADEKERRLLVRRQQFVLLALYKYAIEDVQLPGLTRGLKARLRAAGIVTAADMDQQASVMTEIAPDHVTALTEWRKYLEAQARAVAPSALQPAETQVVRAAYARRRQQLEEEWHRWQMRVGEEEQGLHGRSRAQQDALNQQTEDVHARLLKEEKQIQDRYTQNYVQLGTDVSRAMQSVSPQLQGATEKLADSQRKLLALRSDRVQLEERMQNEYRAVNFLNYLRWIWFGKRAT